MRIKGVDVSKLTKSQQNAMKKHSKHHTKKHMQYMYNSMRRGSSFNKAHVNAQKKVGKYWQQKLVGCGVAKDIMEL